MDTKNLNENYESDASETGSIWDEVDAADATNTQDIENPVSVNPKDTNTESDLTDVQEYLENFEKTEDKPMNEDSASFEFTEPLQDDRSDGQATEETALDTNEVQEAKMSESSASNEESAIKAEELSNSSKEETIKAKKTSKKDKKNRAEVKANKKEKKAKAKSIEGILEKKKQTKVRLFNISTKLVILCILPLVILCVVTSLASSSILRTNLENEIQSSLKIVAVSLQQTYSSLYEGEYHSDLSGALYKGDTKISKDMSLVDALREQTGYENSFYYDRRSVVTSMKKRMGTRNVGHMLDKDLYNRILEGEEIFVTDLEIDDITYFGYFIPLVNSDGSIPGCVFAGKPADEVNASIKSETQKIMLASILISCACIFIILFFSSSMSQNMKRTKDFLGIVSTGNLTQNVNMNSLKRNDELGDMYAMSYGLQENLKDIVSKIKTSANELALSGDDLMEISTGTTQNVESLCESIEFISKGANDQAIQTGLAAEQATAIGEQIDDISKQIESLSNLADKMSEAEKSSTSIIRELNVSNEDMIHSIEQIAKQIEITNTSIQNIKSAVAMIKAITDETDLLSINASIEAAHAGDAGRGFAVVAEQISKLAAQSGNNATEIESIINSLLKESQLMVKYMDDVKIKIDEQREKLELTIEGFSSVATSVESSNKNINKISIRMEELSKSRDVILDVINDLSAVSDQYAASTANTIESAQDMTNAMETLGNASLKLKEMADALYNELGVFIIE